MTQENLSNCATKELVVMRGPSGSGKSTFSKQLIKLGYCYISKDFLRTMLHNDVWNKYNEKATVRAQSAIVNDLLALGRKVVIDNTHLLPKDREEWYSMAQRHDRLARNGLSNFYKVDMELVDMFDVPIEVCMERDSRRTGTEHVGDEVIRRQFKLMRELIEYEANA